MPSKLTSTGAKPSARLLGSQQTILKRILLHIYEIARLEAAMENGKSRDVYLREQYDQRPHHIFLVDGARGSGKTTVLLTIRYYLQFLGRPQKWTRDSELDKVATGTLVKLAEDVAKGMKDYPEAAKQLPLPDFKKGHTCQSQDRQTAFYLPVLFPSDLEMDQSIMEGLLALMLQSIDNIAADKEHSKHHDLAHWKSEAKKIKETATQKVAQGWFLSRSAGTDAILRDSIDYRDYLNKRSDANASSFARVTTWRDFVNDYLNFFNSELLVVFFDDTDLAPEVTRDILHTMRIFLDHPRIVTVIAGNLRAMRQCVLLEGMRDLRDPMAALPAGADYTARNWRSFLRRHIEESLDKVLPRHLRHYIVAETAEPPHRSGTAAQAAHAQGVASESGEPPKKKTDGDFASFFGRPLDALCGDMLDHHRDEFLITKQKAHFRWLDDRQEIADDNEYTTLENYTSWWMFRHWYAEQLRPRSARHMAALRAFTPMLAAEEGSTSPVDYLPSENKKRLTVILFESPENHILIHRMADEDRKILPWLTRQKVRSCWTANRYFEINDRQIDEHTYTHDFLAFRTDVSIAMPVLEHPGEALPIGLLPRPAGPNLNAHRLFFPRLKRHRLYGVASDLDHTLVPANCLYLSDANALPDIAWEESGERVGRDSWGSRLIYDWPRRFFFDFDDYRQNDADSATSAAAVSSLPTVAFRPASGNRNIPAEHRRWTANDPAAPTAGTGSAGALPGGDQAINIWWVKEYFVSVVLPFASIEVGRFVRTPFPFRADDASEWSMEDLAQQSLLHAELKRPNSFFAEEGALIDGFRREYDYLEALAREQGATGALAAAAANRTLMEWKKSVFNGVFPRAADQSAPAIGANSLLRQHLVNYQWLLNDVRRAWHAARIFLSQTSSALRKQSAQDLDNIEHEVAEFINTPEITSKDRFSREDRYAIATRQAFDRWLRRSKSLNQLLDQVEDSYKKWTGKILPEDLRKLDVGVKRDPKTKFYVLDPEWLRGRVCQDINAIIDYGDPTGKRREERDLTSLTAAELKLFLRTRQRDPAVRTRQRDPLRWPLLLDPGLHETSEGPDREKISDGHRQALRTARGHARISRMLLLFLYGVSSSLPSLIHIETASVLRRARAPSPDSPLWLDDADVDQARQVLYGWEKQIWRHLQFVQSYRRVLEIATLRLDLMLICRESYRGQELEGLKSLLGIDDITPRNFGVAMTFAPDMTHASLGVEGIRLFKDHEIVFYGEDRNSKLCGPLQSQLKALQDHWTKSDQTARRVQWRSVIGVTIDNLVEALNFICATREAINQRRSGS